MSNIKLIVISKELKCNRYLINVTKNSKLILFPDRNKNYSEYVFDFTLK